MYNIFQLCDFLNDNNLSASEIDALVEFNGFTSNDSVLVAENETHVICYAEDCVTFICEAKNINL